MSCTPIGCVGGITASHDQFKLVFLKYSTAMWATILTAVPSHNSGGFGTAQKPSQNWTELEVFLCYLLFPLFSFLIVVDYA